MRNRRKGAPAPAALLTARARRKAAAADAATYALYYRFFRIATAGIILTSYLPTLWHDYFFCAVLNPKMA